MVGTTGIEPVRPLSCDAAFQRAPLRPNVRSRPRKGRLRHLAMSAMQILAIASPLRVKSDRKSGVRKCPARTPIKSGLSPRARSVARNACESDRVGCICDFAASAGMSVAAMIHPIVTPVDTLTPAVIRSSRATTRRKAGAGAISMTLKSIFRTRHRTMGPFRASSESWRLPHRELRKSRNVGPPRWSALCRPPRTYRHRSPARPAVSR